MKKLMLEVKSYGHGFVRTELGGLRMTEHVKTDKGGFFFNYDENKQEATSLVEYQSSVEFPIIEILYNDELELRYILVEDNSYKVEAFKEELKDKDTTDEIVLEVEGFNHGPVSNNKSLSKRDEVYKKALATFGKVSQMMMVIEETSELQKEISKNFRGEDNIESIAEEIADVIIMLNQMKIYFDIHKNVESWIDIKTDKLIEKIEEEEVRVTKMIECEA